MKTFIKMIPILFGLSILIGVPALYFWREQLAKPILLAVAYKHYIQERGTVPPDDVYPDGTVVHWGSDDYQCPTVRCIYTTMKETKCIMVWEAEQPCETRIKEMCRKLFPCHGHGHLRK